MGFLWRKWTDALSAISGGKDVIIPAFKTAIETGTPLEITVFARDLIARCHDDEEAVEIFFAEAEKLYAMQGYEDHKRMAIEMVMLPFGTHRRTGAAIFDSHISDIFKPRAVEFLNLQGQEYAQEHWEHVQFVQDQMDILSATGMDIAPQEYARSFDYK